MQIVGFKWINYEPFLILDDERRLPLFDQRLNFRVGKRFCIGYFKNGKRHPCPEHREVKNSYQCEICKRLDENLPCTRCIGFCINPKRRPKCMKETYYVYLATFGNILKVGISIEHRVRQRLVEQGADFGVRLFKITDGALARRHEQRIKKILKIVDRVNGREKHMNLYVDEEIPVRNISNAIEKLRKYYEIDQKICDLRKYYNLKKIRTRFVKVKEGTVIRGKVVSVKGNLIIMENPNISINAHELIGREIYSTDSQT